MHWTTPLKQDWLLGYENPLTDRLGRNFFLTVPKTPGVYRFYGHYAGEDSVLLYVGKAKSLRARLNSYRQAKPDAVSRKVLWMLWQVQRIEYETCESEKSALLRENELLRALRPPFNVVNTSPENYRFIAIIQDARGLQLRHTDEAPDSSDDSHERFHGVFKSRASVRDAYAAVLRLLWMGTQSGGDDGRYEIPGRLLRYRPPNPHSFPELTDPRWAKLLNQFFSGRSRALLRRLTSELLGNETIPPFLYHRVQEDLEELSEFYKSCCRRNRRLCRHFGRKSSFIAQYEIDDWIVAFNHKEEKA